MKRLVVGLATLAFLVGFAPQGSAAKPGFPIVYMSVRGGDGGLYLLNGRTSRAIRGAASNGHDCGPAIRPQGGYMAFESNRLTYPYSPTNFEIYTLNLKTNKLKRLTNFGGADVYPAWSPDGRKIVFSRDDVPLWASPTTSLWVMNADGSHQLRLTHAAPGTGHVTPAWSPDGKRILFAISTPAPSSSGLYTVDANGNNLRKLTEDGEYPSWSPDGQWIAFDSARGETNPFETDIYAMRSDGSHVQRIAHRPGSDVMPSWSPDGKHITYVHDDDYWTGQIVVAVLPALSPQPSVEIYGSGNAPARVWELTLNRSHKAISDKQLSNGEHDLFPHYSPVRSPM